MLFAAAIWANDEAKALGTFETVSETFPETVRFGCRFDGTMPINIGGTEYEHGIGVHADSHLRYTFNKPIKGFKTAAGIDYSVKASPAMVQGYIEADGREVYRSEVLTKGGFVNINLSFDGITQLDLFVHRPEGSYNSDHWDWADAKVITEDGKEFYLDEIAGRTWMGDMEIDFFRKYPAAAEGLNDITVYSPVEYQVFQRQSKNDGMIYFSGRVNVPCDKLSYRIIGSGINGKAYTKSFKNLKLYDGGNFREYVKGWAGGWYTIELKAEKAKKIIAEYTVEHVGIGEVFVGAGQSNSACWGQYPTKQESGMVACTDGKKWQLCNDPLIGTHDNYLLGGSYYPAFGDLLYKEFGVPVGIACVGQGGISIEGYMPNQETYLFMVNRMNQLGKGGFRAVLWHQGEANVETPVRISVMNMAAIIRSSCRDAGWNFPWFTAKVSYHNPEHPSWPLMREAHQKLWDDGISLEGPDTDTLTGKMRDFDGNGIHFSPAGLKAHAALWAEKVIPYIHSVIDKK